MTNRHKRLINQQCISLFATKDTHKPSQMQIYQHQSLSRSK